MKLAITARIRRLFDRYSVRITIGVLFSLFVHGFILSLQLGFPGLGLPGLGLPWSERRAQTPELSIRIANLAGSPTVEQQTSPPPIHSDAVPKPEEAIATSDQPLTELPNAQVKQAPARSAPVSTSVAKALKSSPAIAKAERKNGTPPPDDQSAPAPARSQTEVIAVSGDHPDSFSIPAPDLDNWWRSVPKADSIPLPIQQPEETAPPTIALQSPKQTIQQSQEPAPALQKPAEQESFERPDEMKAKEPEPSKTPEVATELAEHKQGEEIAAQDAAHKPEEQEAAQRAQDEATRKQEDARIADEAARQIAAKKLEEQQVAQREAEAAEKKLEAEKQQKQEAERQEKELAARKQAEEVAHQQAVALALQKQQEAAQAEEVKRQEQAKAAQQAIELAARQQAEEAARQKAAAIEKQKQEEQLAAQQKAQELAARQKADAEAALQRESARAAAAAAATATAAGSTSGISNAQGAQGATAGANGNGNGNQSQKGNGAGNLASRALEQIGKIDLTRIAPPLPGDADHPEEDSRRHSIFGMIDHDVVVDAYIRGWRSKIERNGSLNYSQSSKDLAREDPVVTVAIRSDGSVEDIVINRSSGRSDLDEAVKRIVRVNAPYSVFPASLARKYPVIEIRRVWNFDETLRLLEEVH